MPSAIIERDWLGATVVCIGGGPSLTSADVEYVRGKARVIAINDAYRLAPWADALYAADLDWWRVHRGVPSFAGVKYSIQPNRIWKNKSGTERPADYAHKDRFPDVHVFRNTGRFGLETDPHSLRSGMNSGAQAIGLARHKGAARILLLGYDCKPTGGESHWFGHHPDACRKASPYSSFNHCFEQMAPALFAEGIDVINCSRETAIACWPQMTIEDALPAQVEAVAS